MNAVVNVEAAEQPVVFIRIEEVRRRTGLSTSTIYAAAKAGTFPKPIKIGPNSSAWVESEIEAHQRALIEKSRSAK